MFAVAATSTLYFFFRVVPACGKHLALIFLHNFRDKLYVSRESVPDLRDSLIYADMEYATTCLINIVRNAPSDEVINVGQKLLSTSAGKSTFGAGDDAWRSQRYDHEIETIFGDHWQILSEDLKRYHQYRLAALTIYLLGVRPYLLLLFFVMSAATLLLFPFLVVSVLYVRLIRPASIKTVEASVEVIRSKQYLLEPQY